MWWFLFDALLVAGGYVASIYSWPWIRAAFIGAEAEYDKLRDRADAVIQKARGL